MGQYFAAVFTPNFAQALIVAMLGAATCYLGDHYGLKDLAVFGSIALGVAAKHLQ